METLVAVAHHQYHGSKRSHGSTSSGSFGGINCRTFHSGEGLPFKSCSTKNSFCSSSSPKTPLPSPSLNQSPNTPPRIAKTTCIPIPRNIDEGGLHFCELWAGPAYSNSPPPSSLPMPNFSLNPKRSVSLDLPSVASEIDFPPFSKSAPASPRERTPDQFDITNSATKTLRRMLNLDICDE